MREKVILKGLMGSRSVGTATNQSDFDYMSVVIPGEDVYLGMKSWGNHGTKESKGDLSGYASETVDYELRKFLHLCQGFNPNVIPLLWLDAAGYSNCSEEGTMLLENRKLFNSKLAYHTFCGYAHGQLKKMGEENPATGKMGAARKALRDKYGMDTKFAYHCVRLCRMLKEFLLTDGEELNVYRGYIDADELFGIRNGSKTYDEVLREVQTLMNECKVLVEKTTLPDQPDKDAINDLCKAILRTHLCK